MTTLISSRAKPVAIVAALAWTTLSLGTAIAPSPAQAAEGVFYRAQLTAPTAKANAIAGGLAWKCADSSCAAAKGTSRPVIVCARLAKEVGPIAAFTAGGKALEPAELARCNGN